MESLTKSRVKLISSLSKKKERDELGLFVAEGPKLVRDLSTVFHCQSLLATETFWTENRIVADSQVLVSEEELKKISFLCAPQSVVAVFEKKERVAENVNLKNTLTLALDTIQDPGNLGTIIRLADWFGIENVVCSRETVDVYNPKVVQATMGALTRVNVYYTDLCQFIREKAIGLPVYGTFLEGDSIYDEPLTKEGVVIMGNEGNGISDSLKKYVTKKLYIPNYPQNRETSESLNVAMATAIACSEFRRRI